MKKKLSILFAIVSVVLASAMLPVDRCLADEAKDLAIQSLADRCENATGFDAVGFKHVNIDGEDIDFVVCNDYVAALFAVYPEERDYVAVARGKERMPLESNELSPEILDDLLVQSWILQKMEQDTICHLTIIASVDTLAGMREAWGDELEEKKIGLVEYKDYENYLRERFARVPGTPDDRAVADEVLGLDAAHPIRVVAMDAEYAYFRRLQTEQGMPARALRWGAFHADGFEGPMDRWLVERAPNSFATLYVYPYGPSNTLVAPPGFSLDMDGIEEEFACFPLSSPPPEDVNAPDPTPAPEWDSALEDAGEPVLVGSVKIPPPFGFVALDSSSDVYRNIQEEVAKTKPMRLVAVFAHDSESADDGNLAIVLAPPSPVSLSEFKEGISSFLDKMFSVGPDSGCYAPHRMTERSLHWTETHLDPLLTEDGSPEPVLVCGTTGIMWISGWNLMCSLSSAQVPPLPEGEDMELVQWSRKRVEDWENRILRANGIDPENADNPGKLLGEDMMVKHPDLAHPHPLVMQPQPQRKTEWWRGWNGFAIKMALKVGLPLLIGLAFWIVDSKKKKN